MVIILPAPTIGTEGERIEVLVPTISAAPEGPVEGKYGMKLMVTKGPLGVSVWEPIMYPEAEFFRTKGTSD